MNQTKANQVAQSIANFGFSLGLSRPTCLVQYAASDWRVTASCADPLTGQYLTRSTNVEADANEELLLCDAGTLLMFSLESTFHTKH